VIATIALVLAQGAGAAHSAGVSAAQSADAGAAQSAGAGAAQSASAARSPSPAGKLPGAAEVRTSLDRGLAFLIASQERDGTWGSARNGTFTDFWENPETHRSWAIGTTGLACMALLEFGSSDAAQRALGKSIDALIGGTTLKRPNEWDLDHVWGHLYGAQALAHCLVDKRFSDDPRRGAMRAAVEKYVSELVKLQSPNGGWGYYAMEDAAWNPEWSTSFSTAAIVLALLDARTAGIAVDEKVIERAERALERCRLPSGAYTYSVEAIPSPGRMEGIDQVKGSLGRIQVCNLALVRTRAALERTMMSIGKPELRRGLDQFFEDHRFLDFARRKPIPHEGFYKNAGYFYFFGHWYAAGVIDELPVEERAPYAAKLAREIMKTQEQDGSMQDYLMHDYVRQYSTAYGVLALGHCLAALK
jgi:hypothetical protein